MAIHLLINHNRMKLGERERERRKREVVAEESRKQSYMACYIPILNMFLEPSLMMAGLNPFSKPLKPWSQWIGLEMWDTLHLQLLQRHEDSIQENKGTFWELCTSFLAVLIMQSRLLLYTRSAPFASPWSCSRTCSRAAKSLFGCCLNPFYSLCEGTWKVWEGEETYLCSVKRICEDHSHCWSHCRKYHILPCCYCDRSRK